MGMIMGKAMDDNMKKNQEFMLSSQRSQFERQLHMQNVMREQMMAVQIARGRDLFLWWATFYAVAGVGMIAGFRKTRNPAAIAPLVPLTFIVGYMGDLAYGTKMQRMTAEAGRILDTETHLLASPQPLPTMEYLDKRRGV